MVTINTAEWRPTSELRYAVPPHTTTEPPKLQQLWVSPNVNRYGHILSHDEEWRDVPRVVLSDPQ